MASTPQHDTVREYAPDITLDDELERVDYDRRGTYTMAGAHAAHDLYGGFLGPLLPEIQAKLAVSLTVVSLMIPAQQLPGIFQPFIGYLADRTSRRWFVVAAPAVTAFSVSAIGLANHVAIVLFLLFISGLASGAFHAPAVALMGEYGGDRMGKAMSLFMAGAEIARALGPLIITAAISWLTLEGSAVVVVFGAAASVILYFTVDTQASDDARREAPSINLRPLVRARARWFGALMAITVLNAIATGPFHFFLVKFLADEKGYGNWYGGFALTLFFSAGVVGMLAGGSIADRIGLRTTIATALGLTSPLIAFYLLIENGGWIPLVALLPAAAILTSVRPLVMAVAQELLPEARGSMAGAMLALGFVSLSLTAFFFGAIADRIGLENAFFGVAIASGLAVPFALMLPRKGERPAG
ncbi:MAG: MFS transporter [Chloroflexota bacterium]